MASRVGLGSGVVAVLLGCAPNGFKSQALNESRARGSKVNRTTKCLPETERENFDDAAFALAFSSRRQDRELPGAISRGLLDCLRRIQGYRLRDGFSVSNAIVLKGSAFYVGNLDGFL